MRSVSGQPEAVLAYMPVNELLTTAFTAQGQLVGTANWYDDASGNQTGNSGYAGVSRPLTVTYNQHHQIATISDLDQHAVTMTWTGPGPGGRTSADWSNDPANFMYGHTTYTTSALGLESITNNLGATYRTRDPAGLPIGLRAPGGTDYYLFDGQGNVVMLVDPPNGAPMATYSMSPTGNSAGDSWHQPGFNDPNVITAGGGFSLISDHGSKQVLGGGQYRDTNSDNPNNPNCLDPTNPEQTTCLVPSPGPCFSFGFVAGISILKLLCEDGIFCAADEGSRGGGKFRWPAAKGFNWDHIFARHAEWGDRAAQRGNPDEVFQGMHANQIEAGVQAVWKIRERAGSQSNPVTGVTRVRYQGVDPVSGRTIEMWRNQATGIVQTAHPVP